MIKKNGRTNAAKNLRPAICAKTFLFGHPAAIGHGLRRWLVISNRPPLRDWTIVFASPIANHHTCPIQSPEVAIPIPLLALGLALMDDHWDGLLLRRKRCAESGALRPPRSDWGSVPRYSSPSTCGVLEGLKCEKCV